MKVFLDKFTYLHSIVTPAMLLPAGAITLLNLLFPNEMLIRAIISWLLLASVDLITKIWSISKKHESKRKFKLKKHKVFNCLLLAPVWIVINVLCFTLWILLKPIRKYYNAALIGDINSEQLGRKTHKKFAEMFLLTIIIRSLMFLLPVVVVNTVIVFVFFAGDWREIQSIFENARDAGLEIEWAKAGIKKKLSMFLEEEEE